MTLKPRYTWLDGTADAKEIAWEIKPADFSAAIFDAIADVEATGEAITPAIQNAQIVLVEGAWPTALTADDYDASKGKTYKVKVLVVDAGSSKVAAGSKTVTLKVKVK